MGRYIKSGVLMSFFILIAASLGCSLFPTVPESTKTPQGTTATSTSTLSQSVAIVESTTTIQNTAIPTVSTATPTTHVIYVIVTATATSTNTPKAQTNTGNQPIAPVATTPPPPTATTQIIVPTATPKPPTATSTSAVVLGMFPAVVGADYTTNAVYQPFEHGFMLWRSDYNCIYAITDTANGVAVIPPQTSTGYGYCLTVAPLSDGGQKLSPPAGLLEPTGAIGKVWHNYVEVRSQLGYATAAEQSYVAGGPPATLHETVMDGLAFYMPQIGLPSGKILACGSRAATAGTCALQTATG